MDNSSPSSPRDCSSSGQMDPVEDIDVEDIGEDSDKSDSEDVGIVSGFRYHWSHPWYSATRSSTNSHWSRPWSFAAESCATKSSTISHWSPPWSFAAEFCADAPDEPEPDSPRNDESDDKTVGVLTGAGFENLGNTCFLNAVLQCFMHTVPLIDGILSDEHLSSHKCVEEFCLMSYLRNLAGRTMDPINKVVSPWHIVNNLSYLSSSFQRYEQEDAHEFLQCFLDRLETCHNLSQKHCMTEGSNIVKQIFGGSLISKVKCHNCGHCSDTYEPLIDLSLEIDDADNLLMALDSFTKVETIDDEETKFTCEGCKEQVAIEKQLSFDQTPSVAAFHLKRFKNDGFVVEKIDKHVAFPLDLDLRSFTASGQKDDEELQYALYAVVVHDGLTPTSGHYYCFIRLSPSTWCKFDDSKTTLVNEDFVLSEEAYILFYAKEGIPWFSSYIETLKVNGESKICNTSPVSVLDSARTSSLSPDLQKSILCGSHETTDTSGSTEKGITVAEIEDDGPHGDSIKGDESGDSLQRIPIQAEPPLPDFSSAVLSSEAQKDVSPSKEVKVDSLEEAGQAETSCAPQRSLMISSPEMSRKYPTSPATDRENQPDAGVSIRRDSVKLISRGSCKRRLDKEMDDSEAKQAFSFIRNSLPSSRGHKLLAALRDGQNKGSSLAKKRKRSKFETLSRRRRYL